MATQADLARVRGEYAQETQVRMKLFAEELQATASTQAAGIDTLWSQLHKQEEASRHAGFVGISRLCQQMQTCLKEAQKNGQTQLPVTAQTMLTVCRAIRGHAVDAEKRTHSLSPCSR